MAKGVANGHRVAMLFLLYRQPGIDLDMISHRLEIGYKNAAEHTRKMLHGGLIKKEYEGSHVLHWLTPRGKRLASFLARLK